MRAFTLPAVTAGKLLASQYMSAPTMVLSLDRVYAEHVNPQRVRLLNLLQMNERYERCYGCELFTSSGRLILDFLSGYCIHNTEHNHPAILAALHEELDRGGPAIPQSNQICGNNFLVLKAAPLLVVTETQLDQFVAAMVAVVDLMHTSGSFWNEALGLARRAVKV
jgi:acetylornithine/succinyldiaminopimelate/putrescine aminotransferase